MKHRRLVVVAAILVIPMVAVYALIAGPTGPAVTTTWVGAGPFQLRVDRVSSFTLDQYRNYQRLPGWLVDLAYRISWLAYLKPPLNGIEAPPYRHETFIVEASVQGNPPPQAQDFEFALELGSELLNNNGHSWANEPGKPLRIQSTFYIPEGSRATAVVITLKGTRHRFPITYR